MRWRTKCLMMALAGLAGFLVSREDIRRYLSQGLKDYKYSLEKAINEGREEVARKEMELEKEVAGAKEESSNSEKK